MNFLICGLGSIGQRHMRILRSTGDNKFIALRSGKSNRKQENPADIEISEVKEAAYQNIEGIIISNPTSLHIETAIELAGLGVPMFIEKPLGRDLEKTDELERIVNEKNIPVLMGYNLIYHPGIEAIKQNIDAGKIGRVISARSQFGTFMPDWHKNEDYRKSYAAKKSMGGGVVLTSIHEQNYLTNLFGEVDDIKAMETGGNNIGIDAEEGVEILLKHKNGVVSNIHLNFYQKPYYRNCQVIGTEGTIFWDFMIPELRILYKDKNEILKLGSGPMELLDISYTRQMEHFVKVIEGKESPRMNLGNGICDMKTAMSILKEIGRN